MCVLNYAQTKKMIGTPVIFAYLNINCVRLYIYNTPHCEKLVLTDDSRLKS